METKYCTNCKFCRYDDKLKDWKCCARGCKVFPSSKTNCGLYLRESKKKL